VFVDMKNTVVFYLVVVDYLDCIIEVLHACRLHSLAYIYIIGMLFFGISELACI